MRHGYLYIFIASNYLDPATEFSFFRDVLVSGHLFVGREASPRPAHSPKKIIYCDLEVPYGDQRRRGQRVAEDCDESEHNMLNPFSSCRSTVSFRTIFPIQLSLPSLPLAGYRVESCSIDLGPLMSWGQMGTSRVLARDTASRGPPIDHRLVLLVDSTPAVLGPAASHFCCGTSLPSSWRPRSTCLFRHRNRRRSQVNEFRPVLFPKVFGFQRGSVGSAGILWHPRTNYTARIAQGLGWKSIDGPSRGRRYFPWCTRRPPAGSAPLLQA